jgi:hypothetical protein
MVAIASTALVVLGALVPWLILAGLLALLTLLIVRLARRRTGSAATGMPGDGPA